MSKNKKYKFDMLTEDLTLGSNNFMGGGSSGNGPGQAAKPRKMSVIDMVKAQNMLKDKEEKNPGALPYPLSTSVMDKFAEAYFAIETIKQTLHQTVNNPLISKDEDNKKAVNKMYDKCRKLQQLIELCGNDLDDLLP